MTGEGTAADEIVLAALKWLAGQQLKRPGRTRETDLLAAGQALWPAESRSATETAEALRAEAIAVLNSLSLPRQDDALLRVLLDNQEIVRDPGSDPSWRLRQAVKRKPMKEVRLELITAFGLICSEDEFRRKQENPALRILAAAVSGSRTAESRTRPGTAAQPPGVSRPEPRPVDDDLTTAALNDLGRQMVLDVLTALFPPPTLIIFEALTPGMSGSSVFRVHPHRGHAQTTYVVKIGPAAGIAAELRAWERHVEPYIRNKHLPGIHNSVLLDHLGGIAYKFFATTTLNDHLAALAELRSVDEIEACVNKLLLIDSQWNVAKRRVKRELFVEDYPLLPADLSAFEAFCSQIPSPLTPSKQDAGLIRRIWAEGPNGPKRLRG